MTRIFFFFAFFEILLRSKSPKTFDQLPLRRYASAEVIIDAVVAHFWMNNCFLN